MFTDRRKILFFRQNYGEQPVPKPLLLLTLLMSLVYFYVLVFGFTRGNSILFALLIFSEIFHLWQLFTYVHTVWQTKHRVKFNPRFTPMVDVFITVAGEPVEIVEKTVLAAKAMRYPFFEIYILNDGYVAKKENWREIEDLARRLEVNCITRRIPGGAKAGNINHGLLYTQSQFLAVFDADHAPSPEFLEKTVGYFTDPKMAFVQTPQFYKNRTGNYLTGAAWEQQELFFGPILMGKNRVNSAFMCGTNMVIRREALIQVGGMNEKNIAEDFLTSLFIHQHGWKSYYVPEVLAEGLAPEDFGSYYNQQYRWARGSLEMIFRKNPLFLSNLTWSQRIQYLASASFYLSGLVVLLNAIFPLVFFFTGQKPFLVSSMALAAVFLPYMLLVIYTLQRSSNYSYTFRALGLSMGAFPIHLKASLAAIFGIKSTFQITAKKKVEGNFIRLAVPHFLYMALVILGIGVALYREGLSASLINNTAWALLNVALFLPFVAAASPAVQLAGIRPFSVETSPATKT